MMQEVPKSEGRDHALSRLAVLEPKKVEPSEAALATIWTRFASLQPTNDFDRLVKTRLVEVGCGVEGAPYVAMKIVEFFPELSAKFLDGKACFGARGIGDYMKRARKGFEQGGGVSGR